MLSHVVSRPTPAVPTDCVHAKDSVAVDNPSVESRSEGIKRLKVLTLVKLVEALKIDMAIIFCRTNLDCDNLEKCARPTAPNPRPQLHAESLTEPRIRDVYVPTAYGSDACCRWSTPRVPLSTQVPEQPRRWPSLPGKSGEGERKPVRPRRSEIGWFAIARLSLEANMPLSARHGRLMADSKNSIGTATLEVGRRA